MRNFLRTAVSLVILLSAAGCRYNHLPVPGESGGALSIYPDYKDVTIPANIAPLNFHYNTDGAVRISTSFRLGDRTVTFRGKKVEWRLGQWKRFVENAQGQTIKVTATAETDGNQVEDRWTIIISGDVIDPYLTYRLIEPAYQMWNEVCIQERCIENFDETTICDFRHTDNACMNCHIHGQQRGDLSMYYIRGPKGGAVLNRNGELRKLNLITNGMISSTVYGDIHPSGRFGVFSTNIIIPGLHSGSGKRMEVYDTESDLTVADFDSNRMVNLPHVARADKLETFPCFSADGNQVYYCVADTVALPENVFDLRYSLLRAEFDSGTGEISESAEIVWDGIANDASVCHPKASPDGRWIMYTVSAYGTFPINHSDSRLQMTDLHDGGIRELEGVKGDKSDTYHSWSSNSRWFVFASKRGDGQYGKPYFCHLDENGNPSKPFVLPQKSSRFYETNLKSFNIPDLGRESTGMTARDAARLCRKDREEFE